MNVHLTRTDMYNAETERSTPVIGSSCNNDPAGQAATSVPTEEEELEDAAVKIQAFYRGYQTRRDLKDAKDIQHKQTKQQKQQQQQQQLTEGLSDINQQSSIPAT